MEPRQAVFPSTLSLSPYTMDPSASPAAPSQWLDIPDATQPVYTTTVFDAGCIIGVRVWLVWAPETTCTALSERPVYHPPTVTLLDVQVCDIGIVHHHISLDFVFYDGIRALRGQDSVSPLRPK
jgi:hypothetical protein